MPRFDIIKDTMPKKSYRVEAVRGMFSFSDAIVSERFSGEIDLEKEWRIGLIYGRSGTGKTTIAREIFGDVCPLQYGTNAIVDEMPENASVKDITQTFNAVGFSSPPSWLKSYSVLSNGERMRVDLARMLLSDSDPIIFDEFTSVVDRTVAKIASAAVSKAVRRSARRFVAVSCHSDIAEWLEPDWTFCTDTMEYARGRLRRPKIHIEIRKEKGMWPYFRKYHYLNDSLNPAADQYVAYYGDEPIAFHAVLHMPHPRVKNLKRASRLVVIPDYQGLGIGSRVQETVASRYVANGFRYTVTSAHPALNAHRSKSKNWKLLRQGRCSGGIATSKGSLMKTVSTMRLTTTWEYVDA